MTVLIVTPDAFAAQTTAGTLAQGLTAAGAVVLGHVPCHLLVREAVRLAPQVVVACLGDEALGASRHLLPGAALQQALALLAESAPRPVLVLGGDGLPDDAAGLLALQVMGWLALPLHDAAWRSTQRLALARFAQVQDLGAALRAAEARLDERKWVDRAKGVLMRHQQLSEDDAFALLRTASMQANLRVGEVSRALIETAQAAEAVNRAGQLRMLSQRCVQALALRASATAGRVRVDDGLDQTLQRLQANLDHLAGLAPSGAVAEHLAATQAAWQALAELATPRPAASRRPDALDRPSLATLQQADDRAENLLDQAEALTAALALASGRRHLRIVNLCGRQRMLSQRLCKQALLAALMPDEAAALQAQAAAETVREFEATLLLLEQAPLASEAIRAALAQARGQWQRLLDGLRRAAGPEAAAGRATLARESQALLGSFEQLTTLYEHSMQVLLG